MSLASMLSVLLVLALVLVMARLVTWTIDGE
jgi:hypothetical protein